MTLTNLVPYSSSGAADDELRQVVSWAACNLPPDYLAFLAATNGADTHPRLPEYYRFWSAAQLMSYNEGYEVNASLPEFIGIGDDGGPSMFLMKRGTWEVFRYPFSLDEHYSERVASSFTALLEHIGELQPNA
jgi:hypothetical protein